MTNHWQSYQNRWHLLEPPLRPNHEVVAAVVDAVGGAGRDVLLLGVTSELVDAFEHLEAVDKSAEMIGKLWHPRVATQQVRHADWLTMDASFGPYEAVVGDGSPNAVQSLDEIDTLLGVVSARLRDGGVFACRVFERPPQDIAERDLYQIISSGEHGNFHAYKWQIAMSLAAEEGPRVPVVNILRRFNELHPDRQAVASQTGWDINAINTIDVYDGSAVALTFPDRNEFAALLAKHFSHFEWRQCGSYDLAERCPIIVASNA